jgi:hypothetical protein
MTSATFTDTDQARLDQLQSLILNEMCADISAEQRDPSWVKPASERAVGQRRTAEVDKLLAKANAYLSPFIREIASNARRRN